MKEVSFIRQNLEKWKSLESLVDSASKQDPGRLAEVYLDITADLSFSKSRYPTSRITLYLNNLTSALHNSLYKNKKESSSRILNFWKTEIPLIMYASRKELKYSFLIFIISAAIGCLTTLNDDMFPRLILSNQYIDMTMRNIETGNPMGVYGSMAQVPMFLYIVFNNVWVSFVVFAAGIFSGFCTGFFLFQNGIMVGTIQTFFFQHSVGFESILAIWLHGTLEISAIIIAGAAGLALGNGWLFPNTYSRGYAFRQGALRGLKIIIGTVPIFLLAGFIEGFLTRHTSTPAVIRAIFILLSLSFVIFYYIYLPKRLNYGQYKNKN